MEIFGIILSVPAAFVANTVYCFIVARVRPHIEFVRPAVWMLSVGVLALLAVELVLMSTIGAVGTQAIVGPLLYPAHLAIFFLGPPALANVLLLQNREWARWFWAVPACTVLAFGLVLLQYGVSEALFGIE